MSARCREITRKAGGFRFRLRLIDSAGGNNTAFIDDVQVVLPTGVNTEDPTTNQPTFYYTYDNLNETTSVSQYDGSGVPLSILPPNPALLRSYTTTSYDAQGRVYLSQTYDINPTNGTLATSTPLSTNDYYGPRGDLIAQSNPGGLWDKYQFDGAGRLIAQYQTDGAGGSSWAAADTATNDHILTQTYTTYDNNGDAILVADYQRENTTTSVGLLSEPSGFVPALVYNTASYYDAANRLIATVNVGTNGNTVYSRPSTVPLPSDTTLVTSYAYSPTGYVQTVTDPRGIAIQTTYDILGQALQTFEASKPQIEGSHPSAQLFHAQNQTSTVSVGTAPTYDNNGNTISDNGQTFVYDAWNRLVAALSGSTTVSVSGSDPFRYPEEVRLIDATSQAQSAIRQAPTRIPTRRSTRAGRSTS